MCGWVGGGGGGGGGGEGRRDWNSCLSFFYFQFQPFLLEHGGIVTSTLDV